MLVGRSMIEFGIHPRNVSAAGPAVGNLQRDVVVVVLFESLQIYFVGVGVARTRWNYFVGAGDAETH